MTNQTSDVKVTRNYEGGIIALVAILLIVVIGGGIYLVSIAVGAAPIVSTIFGMMFAILTTVYIVSLMVQNRWAIQKISDTSMSTAEAFAKALMSYKSQRNEAQPQPVMTTYMAPNRAPEIPAATSVPRLLTNGRPVGVKLQTLTPTGDVLTCSPAGLEVALKILADGEQPTREAFKKRGIYSSTEIAGAVDWIAGQGQIVKSGQGAATRWANGVTPASAPTLADEFRPYCPSLPYFISQPFVEEMTEAGQVGQQAGRQVRGGRK